MIDAIQDLAILGQRCSVITICWPGRERPRTGCDICGKAEEKQFDKISVADDQSGIGSPRPLEIEKNRQVEEG
ncbi:hypothetical protein [Sinorhizobium americanum]|uniref:hypothetical protein n=1 Tax=Sinorhizobium americanum TaxID=194963 RepID=UPI002E1480D5